MWDLLGSGFKLRFVGKAGTIQNVVPRRRRMREEGEEPFGSVDGVCDL
jgi:hypothetical protein